MRLEVAGSEAPQVNGEAKVELHGKENSEVNGSEPIKFGSHGIEEQEAKGDAKNVSKANVPTNAVDEWPDTPKIHSFWVVKYRSYEDPSLKAKIDQVDREIQKINHRTSQIIDQLKPKRAARAELKEELVSLAAENSQYGAVINEKRQEMKPLQDALGTLRGFGGGVGICSTEDELNDLIRSLEYQMQHETMSLKEEKQLLREIKELEATRPQVVANTARRAKIQDSLGKTEVIQDQVKLLGTGLDGVKKQRAAIKARMDHLGQQVKALDDQINPLKAELAAFDEKRTQAFDTIRQLRTKRDEGNASVYQNRNVLNSVKELAAKKDLKALEELVHAEVEKFMSQWNSSKAFRDDYEKRILLSLDMRQLSRDGWIRNFDEKPLVKPEESRPQIEALPKATHKTQKADPKTSAKAENSPAQKADKESKKNNKESKIASERAIEEEEVFVVEKPKKLVSQENEVDVAKLKEMKREEEKEKQRQALERKKKQQEKAAGKAALRAQKEAEKKQKDREKKLKKKEATLGLPTNEEELGEKEAEAAENEKLDNTEVAVETSVMPSKAKEQKDNAIRYRKNTKTRGTLPKAILKKKKNNQYWVWASAASAAVVVVMLVALGYNYLL